MTLRSTAAPTTQVFRKLKIVLEMIKIEHTVFALPFAFMGAFLAARGLPPADKAAWILLAMVGARSAAMAFNRLVDLPFDAKNPRTASRALPQGSVSRAFVIVFVCAASTLFIFAASRLNPLALAVIFFYSYTKRFTWATHLFLGLSLAGAPLGAWIAIRGDITSAPLILGLAVALWVAGLDVIYACQDVAFDRQTALHSIPERFGIRRALLISGILHLVMIGLLAFLFWREGLGSVSLAGLAVVAVLLAYEHALVKPGDLSRVNTAFFTINGWISVLLFVSTAADLLWRPSS